MGIHAGVIQGSAGPLVGCIMKAIVYGIVAILIGVGGYFLVKNISPLVANTLTRQSEIAEVRGDIDELNKRLDSLEQLNSIEEPDVEKLAGDMTLLKEDFAHLESRYESLEQLVIRDPEETLSIPSIKDRQDYLDDRVTDLKAEVNGYGVAMSAGLFATALAVAIGLGGLSINVKRTGS